MECILSISLRIANKRAHVDASVDYGEERGRSRVSARSLSWFARWMMRRIVIRLMNVCVFAAMSSAPAARSQVRQLCGEGIGLRLNSPMVKQGGLLLVDIRSAKAVREVTGEWDGRSVVFWEEKAKRSGRGGSSIERRSGLLGVDLEKPPGQYELTVIADLQDGNAVKCNAKVMVEHREFATERLQVEKKFVEPDPEQLERAKKEQERLRELFAQLTPERYWQGRFRLPLHGVKKGANFGRRRVLNGQPGSPHTGVDFPAPSGTLVYAAQRGRAVLAEPLFFSGNTVIVDHGLGVYSLYGHLSQITVQTGDMVKEGAVLGKVGATGRVTGPHLHWGLTVNKARVDPLQILKLAGW